MKCRLYLEISREHRKLLTLLKHFLPAIIHCCALLRKIRTINLVDHLQKGLQDIWLYVWSEALFGKMGQFFWFLKASSSLLALCPHLYQLEQSLYILKHGSHNSYSWNNWETRDENDMFLKSDPINYNVYSIQISQQKCTAVSQYISPWN